MESNSIALAGQQALWTALLVGGPLLGLLLVIGLAIALVQALTQIQEPSLAFVPKVVALGAVLLLGGSAGVAVMRAFTERLFDQIISVGGMG
ncbi:EscS/YscS/HrcS family type III secretion system export apparatus protein [Roseomonas frigidaquae]|uniref:EscS/YscS/HrcS family type III secretion system export apparatus protein n=1 Tax=Falsiroseomonas frigidaquae TaxID=487318 RepID=A0ABX1ET32_9PROT|nr:flagellar biosynthetic protein FliQ [Falsiroseomonas frigidaquae]NKE43293.1 EscS/YscS/HrcS family type III secretion system export apparatus protein [Falsiroseomonas frigidaquae]